MGSSWRLLESPIESGSSGESLPSPHRLAELEQLWAERPDESLEEAAHNLLDYTGLGQRVIREELQRRSIPVPGSESPEEESDEFLEQGSGAVYSNPDFLHVEALQGVLKSHGVVCEIRTSRSGPLSHRPWPELWTLDESQIGQARQMVQAALDEAREKEFGARRAVESDRETGVDGGLEADDEPPEGAPSWTWTCPRCSEDVETQFSECWNCGSERPPQ